MAIFCWMVHRSYRRLPRQEDGVPPPRNDMRFMMVRLLIDPGGGADFPDGLGTAGIGDFCALRQGQILAYGERDEVLTEQNLRDAFELDIRLIRARNGRLWSVIE